MADLSRRLFGSSLQQHSKQINAANVKGLTPGGGCIASTTSARRRDRRGGRAGYTAGLASPPQIKSTPLMINGMLYFSGGPITCGRSTARHRPRRVALRVERRRGGDHIGQPRRRQSSITGCVLPHPRQLLRVARRGPTGQERLAPRESRNMKREYFSTNAPMIIGRQGDHRRRAGDALDIPGYLEVARPGGRAISSGRWKYNAARQGRPARATWPKRRRDGPRAAGCRGFRGTYDPEFEPLLSRDRQSGSRWLAGASRPGDKPLHLHDRGAQTPRLARWAWALPGDAARHATTGDAGADTGADRRRFHHGRPRKMLAAGEPQRNISSCSISRSPANTCSRRSTSIRSNWTTGINATGAAGPRSREGRERGGARWSRRTRAERPTGRPPSFSSRIPALMYFGTRPDLQRLVPHRTPTGRPQGWAAAERNVGNVGNALKAVD